MTQRYDPGYEPFHDVNIEDVHGTNVPNYDWQDFEPGGDMFRPTDLSGPGRGGFPDVPTFPWQQVGAITAGVAYNAAQFAPYYLQYRGRRDVASFNQSASPLPFTTDTTALSVLALNLVAALVAAVTSYLSHHKLRLHIGSLSVDGSVRDASLQPCSA
jgi:hypothetical protein